MDKKLAGGGHSGLVVSVSRVSEGDIERARQEIRSLQTKFDGWATTGLTEDETVECKQKLAWLMKFINVQNNALDENKSQFKRMKAEIERLQMDIEKLQGNNASLVLRMTKVERDKDDLDIKNAQLTDSIATLTGQVEYLMTGHVR